MTSPTPTTSSAPVAPAARSADDRQQLPRTRAARTGGPRLKLNVFKEIEGFHLYWANDEDAAIEQLLSEGFDFVKPDEAGMKSLTNVVADADLTDRVSKYVGTKADGTPLRAYLLKCPNEVWEEIQAANQQQADEWDGQIRSGAVENVENRYVPKGFEIKVTTGQRR